MMGFFCQIDRCNDVTVFSHVVPLSVILFDCFVFVRILVVVFGKFTQETSQAQ